MVLGASCTGVPGIGASLHIWHPRTIPQGSILHLGTPQRGHPMLGMPCTTAPSAFPTHALPGSEHQAAGVGAMGQRDVGS